MNNTKFVFDNESEFAYVNLEQWLLDSPNCSDIESAVTAVTHDSGAKPHQIKILGVLLFDCENGLTVPHFDKVQEIDTVKGYPGAPHIEKCYLDSNQYYLISMYDGTLVATV
jgi:hypothetical protein